MTSETNETPRRHTIRIKDGSGNGQVSPRDGKQRQSNKIESGGFYKRSQTLRVDPLVWQAIGRVFERRLVEVAVREGQDEEPIEDELLHHDQTLFPLLVARFYGGAFVFGTQRWGQRTHKQDVSNSSERRREPAIAMEVDRMRRRFGES